MYFGVCHYFLHSEWELCGFRIPENLDYDLKNNETFKYRMYTQPLYVYGRGNG